MKSDKINMIDFDAYLVSKAKEELKREQAEGYVSVCGDYDLVRVGQSLYRAYPDMYKDVLMKAPIPSKFWALRRLMPD